MSGTLYIVSVPIGNYGDMTQRAREVLESVDFIASEDTRRTAILLTNLNIENRNRLISNHKFNEAAKSRYFINDLMDGKDVAIVTDAGTPCISDPGNELIRDAVEQGIRVTAVPGCCAAIAALTVTGFDLSRFSFHGFFPRENATRKKLCVQIRRDARIPTVVFYESPKRIIETTEYLAQEFAGSRLCLCNDLTKLHEYMYRGTVEEVLDELKARETAEKGEYVIVMEISRSEEDSVPAEQYSPEALLTETIVREGLSMKEAIKKLASDPEISYSKNVLYEAGLHLKEMF